MLLAARDYTTARLREKLIVKAFTEEDADSVVTTLTVEGWVDDRRFAERFAESAVASGRFYGPRLRQEMRRRGVPADLIDELLGRIREEHDEVEKAAAILARRYSDFSFLSSSDKEKRRIIGFLQRRGFAIAAVMQALREK